MINYTLEQKQCARAIRVKRCPKNSYPNRSRAPGHYGIFPFGIGLSLVTLLRCKAPGYQTIVGIIYVKNILTNTGSG